MKNGAMMKNWIFILLSVIMSGSLYAADIEPDEVKTLTAKDKLHVYLLIGQSNMAGRSPYVIFEDIKRRL